MKNKTWLVFKNEFLSAFFRKSYLLTLILIPLTSFIVLLVISGLQKSSGVDASQMINELFIPENEETMKGYIDQSGLIKTIPADLASSLVSFETEEDAKSSITKGEISAYYIIPVDFLKKGDITYVRPDYNPMGGITQSGIINSLIAYNLVDGNVELSYRVQNPLNVKEIDLSNSVQREDSNMLTFFLPYAVTFLFYITILTSSSLLLNSISNEKQNRVLEILMTSVTPMQMLTGKIIALGLTGLLQTFIWSAAGLLLLRFSGKAFSLSSAFQLPASILLWGVLFFLLGYAVYASLMAGIGALVSNLREASQLTTMVILPMIVPLMLISTLIQTPNSPLAVFLSIFPLTSPVSMMTRLAASNVPFWQTGLAVLLLLATAYLFVRASAGLFRAQNLLSGKTVNTRDFIKALAGR